MIFIKKYIVPHKKIDNALIFYCSRTLLNGLLKGLFLLLGKHKHLSETLYIAICFPISPKKRSQKTTLPNQLFEQQSRIQFYNSLIIITYEKRLIVISNHGDKSAIIL